MKLKFKKLTSVLASLLLSGSLMTSGAYAQSAGMESYMESIKKTFSWTNMTSESKGNIDFKIKDGNYEDKQNYDVYLGSEITGFGTGNENEYSKIHIFANFKNNSDIKDGKSFLEKLPAMDIYVTDKDIYVNREFFNLFVKEENLGVDKITKDFVKISIPKEVIDDEGMKEIKQIIKAISKNKGLYYEGISKFMKKIDEKVNLGIEVDKGDYVINYNQDKLVDVLDRYIRFILTDFDAVRGLYKDCFGIDIDKSYVKAGAINSKEELDAQLKQLLTLYEQYVAPKLWDIKRILDGTNLNVRISINSNDIVEKIKLNVNVDGNEINKVFLGQSLPNEPKDKYAKLVINLDSKTVNNNNLEIKLPESVYQFDLEKYANENEKKLEQLKKQQEALQLEKLK